MLVFPQVVGSYIVFLGRGFLGKMVCGRKEMLIKKEKLYLYLITISDDSIQRRFNSVRGAHFLFDQVTLSERIPVF